MSNETETEAKTTDAKAKKVAEKSAANPAPSTSSKASELLKAANARAAANAERGEDQVSETQRRYETEVSDEVKDAAQEEADTRVQSRANSLTGALDVEAMGDVKGNGGDAKNYDDADPDKALGVPTHQYGLNDIKGGAAVRRVFDDAQYAKTSAEIERGKKALSDRKAKAK